MWPYEKKDKLEHWNIGTLEHLNIRHSISINQHLVTSIALILFKHKLHQWAEWKSEKSSQIYNRPLSHRELLSELTNTIQMKWEILDEISLVCSWRWQVFKYKYTPLLQQGCVSNKILPNGRQHISGISYLPWLQVLLTVYLKAFLEVFLVQSLRYFLKYFLRYCWQG